MKRKPPPWPLEMVGKNQPNHLANLRSNDGQCQTETASDRRITARLGRNDFVYFVEAGPGGPVKVGVSCNPRARLRAIQIAHHLELSIVGVLVGSYDLERDLHELFSEHWIRGEWFARAAFDSVVSVAPDLLREGRAKFDAYERVNRATTAAASQYVSDQHAARLHLENLRS